MATAGQQGEFTSLLRALRDHVEVERGLGVRWLPRAPVTIATARPRQEAARAAPPRATGPSRPVAAAPAAAMPAGRDAGAVAPDLAAATTLGSLAGVLGECRRCKLAGGRTHIVFGVGNEDADLMFVGEGPGRDEDLRGEPFVGRAGQLLTDIIVNGMKLRREDVYIANVIKCRPPQNRNPEPDEIDRCIPFLARQIEIVRPRVIVALGKFAAQTLLNSTTPITRLRGQWHDYRGVKLMPTLHPAYLLRNPADKRLVWEDVKQVMTELGLA
jgi:DNA polymerase